MIASSSTPADGITSRPVYDYQPPAWYFGAGEPNPADVFDIRDFGAIAAADVNNQPMIQAAIEAAHAAGGGIVYIPPGTWGIAANPDGYGSVHVLDNVFLKGAGMGESVLRLVDGSTDTITGLVRSSWGEETTNWGLADLTIDGNMANTSGQVDGFFTGPLPGSTMTDKDIHVLRVEIENVSRYGFDPHERTERLSIKDSIAHDNGVDGFVLDFNIDAELTGNTSFANGRHGFNFVTTSHDILLSDNVAHDNGGAGFVIQRGSENIESPHAIRLVGGAAFDNGREGVLVQMSDDIVVSGMDIHGNGRSGVRIYGSSNVTIEGNDIAGNSQSLHDGYSEVDIAGYVDAVHGTVYAAEHNLITGNTIAATGAIAARFGIEERAGSTASNTVADNVVSGTVRGPLALNGLDSYALKLGSDGNDTLLGSATQDRLVGGAGDDAISGQDGNDLLEGGAGIDTLTAGKGDDALYGGDGNDALNGNSGNDRLAGEAGNDRLIGDAGDDHLDGGAGDDNVNGGSGNDRVLADAGNDVLVGGSGFDTLDFSEASNSATVDLTAKTASGAGSDTVSGFERIIGSGFADTIKGDKSANVLDGGAGDDTLRGMGGADQLSGGEGHDTFVWAAARDVVDSGVYLGLDRITDFAVGDRLDVKALTGSATAASAIDDHVRITDGAEGSLVSVRIAGTFHDVALLEGAHGLTATGMLAAGMLLV